jgi:hypothetical protein
MNGRTKEHKHSSAKECRCQAKGSMPESPACEQQSNDNYKPRRQPLHRAPHRLRPARQHPKAATQASCENLAAAKRTHVASPRRIRLVVQYALEGDVTSI